jgi:hypothetical protein
MADYMRVMFEKSGEAVMAIENGRVVGYYNLDGSLLFDVAPTGEGCEIVEKNIKFTPSVVVDPDPDDPPVDDQSERVALLEARLAETFAMLQQVLNERIDFARTVIAIDVRLAEIRTELGV